MLAANMGIALRADTSCTVLSAAGPGATARAACDFVFSNNLLYVSFCFLLKRKKAGTSKRNPGFLQILHCLFHRLVLLLRLLRQKQFDLLLYALKLLFFGIGKRCVGFQRKRTRIPDHGKLLIRKKALSLHQTGADSEVLFCRFVVFHEVMPGMNTLSVEVPFPRHKFSARFAGTPGQHCITEIRKHLVGIIQTDDLQRGRSFKDPHILFDMPGSLYHRSKLSVYFRSCDICRSETDDTVSVNRAERLLVPSDVDQTVFQQPCVQLPVQELLFYLSQISFFLRCVFFAHF